jgi:hypothetical protein
MSYPSKRSSYTSGILHLISLGFVSAATITLFGVAFVSFLDTGKEPPASSHSVGSVFRYADDNAAPIPAQTSSPTLASAKLPLAVPEQAVSLSETPEVSDPKPGSELPPRDYDASTTTSESRQGIEITGPPFTKTQSAEVSGSEHTSTERRPIADEMSTVSDPSQQTVRN